MESLQKKIQCWVWSEIEEKSGHIQNKKKIFFGQIWLNCEYYNFQSIKIALSFLCIITIAMKKCIYECRIVCVCECTGTMDICGHWSDNNSVSYDVRIYVQALEKRPRALNAFGLFLECSNVLHLYICYFWCFDVFEIMVPAIEKAKTMALGPNSRIFLKQLAFYCDTKISK